MRGVVMVDLLDVTGAVLVRGYVTPGMAGESSHEPSLREPHAEEEAVQFFSVSLPWTNDTAQLRVTCDETLVATKERSFNLPVVDFVGLAEGATLSGETTIQWSGSDPDGDQLLYQVQFAGGNNTGFTPLMPWQAVGNLTIDTTKLPSVENRDLRVLVSDGFHTIVATRQVDVVNPLQIQAVVPADGATDVVIDDSIQVIFVSQVDDDSLEGGALEVQEGMAVVW